MKKRLTAKEKKLTFEKNSKILSTLFSKRTNFIGVDLGTHKTGFFCGIKKDRLLTADSKETRNKRIFKINKQFKKLLIKPNSSIVIIEDYAMSPRKTTMIQIAELGGVIKNSLIELKIPYLTLAPQTLKKFVLGPSRSSKQQKQFMLMEVLDRWHIKFDDDNVCDAYCLYKFMKVLKFFLNNPTAIKKWEQQMFTDFVINRGKPENL